MSLNIVLCVHHVSYLTFSQVLAYHRFSPEDRLTVIFSVRGWMYVYVRVCVCVCVGMLLKVYLINKD